ASPGASESKRSTRPLQNPFARPDLSRTQHSNVYSRAPVQPERPGPGSSERKGSNANAGANGLSNPFASPLGRGGLGSANSSNAGGSARGGSGGSGFRGGGSGSTNFSGAGRGRSVGSSNSSSSMVDDDFDLGGSNVEEVVPGRGRQFR